MHDVLTEDHYNCLCAYHICGLNTPSEKLCIKNDVPHVLAMTLIGLCLGTQRSKSVNN